jgi:hypothetical protein
VALVFDEAGAGGRILSKPCDGGTDLELVLLAEAGEPDCRQGGEVNAVFIIGIEAIVIEVDGDDVVQRRFVDGRTGMARTVKDEWDLAERFAAA